MSIDYFINFYVAKFLPFLSLSLFFYQFLCHYLFYYDREQAKNNIMFTITKYMYIFFYLMALISFIMIFTDPGYVTEETNEKFLYLY